jgi:small-conductance mechanosensitive channel
VSRINPTLRGFAIIVLIAGAITVLNLQTALNSLLLIARVAFFLAIAFFLYLLWRDRREEISMWEKRSQAVFYGAVALAVANLGASFWAYPDGGLETLVFVGVFVACGYALWRTWRQEHTYTY